METVSYQISSTVIVIEPDRGLSPAVPNTLTIGIVVIWLTQEIPDCFTNYTSPFVIMGQVVVHLWVRDPLRINDTLVGTNHMVTAHTVVG